MAGRVHVIGAGLAGLAAAVAIARDGGDVALYEAATFAGGRCRSYDDASLGLRIDNGNHLVLSGNRETMAYARTLGTSDLLVGPDSAIFPFVDLRSAEQWRLHLSDSRIPWWIFDAKRRVPGTGVGDYLPLLKLLHATPQQTIADRLGERAPEGLLYHRLLQPLLLAALNTEPLAGSAALAAEVIRETLSAGGQACRPLVAHSGLSDVFVEPALAYLRERGVPVHMGKRLRALGFGKNVLPRVVSLDFADGPLALAEDDSVILALPAQSATTMVPGIDGPDAFRSIVNAHYRIKPPPGCPPIIGVINGTAEWVFAFDDRLSVTISGADRLLDIDRETLAETIWRDVARTVWGEFRAADTKVSSASLASLASSVPDMFYAAHPMPRWQIVREKRATFAALPEQDAKRPGTLTGWNNLFLAGDWTRTGLPATIEGAIRSGNRAATAIQERHRR